MTIPIIDLFAGPGGLGEGFAAFKTEDGFHPFKLSLSIEKDTFAHRTLLLRGFFRQFERNQVPVEYYQYCQGQITREELFEAHPVQADYALGEAWNAELGNITPAILHQRILSAIGTNPNWVLVGGPPCQAYSTVGRARMRGTNPAAFEADKRHFLYREYLSILRKYSPAVFVMENVRGLLSSTISGRKMFEKILADLRRKPPATRQRPNRFGYDIYSLTANGESTNLSSSDFLLRFEDHGVPQNRHRVVIVGIRRDLNATLRSIEKNSETPTVADAIKDLPALRSTLSREDDSFQQWVSALSEFRALDWEQHAYDQPLMTRIERAVENAVDVGPGDDRFLSSELAQPSQPSEWTLKHSDWFLDPNLGGTLNHKSRSHMRKDLLRYLFVSAYGEVKRVSPRLRDFPSGLLPDHANVHKAMGSDYFADRFRVQVWNEPSTTILSHMAKDGHYFIHPSPEQCRSLTVREAARLQTFPDNYFFEGPRTEQYRQVGNAVPPLFAMEIASHVHDVISQIG